MIDDVRLVAAGLVERLLDGACLGDHLEVGAAIEQRHQALADHLVVVDDQEAEWPSAARRPDSMLVGRS